ncbi:MAG TPA: TPM domain-containing protein [Candidatus Acidoferrales bacterium]|nr:TPM domain-containing protein [Candidatus Acidoferrales bacterium]
MTALAALILSPALCICVRAQKVKDLKPQGYVDDFAGVLGSSTVDRLTTLCSEVDKKAQAQIAVVTVKALNGQSIEEFTIDLATHWGVGPKQQSRGVMILVAPHDRKYRIEVGYGLEGILPDGKVGSFGRQAVPYFQHQDFDGAVWLMTERVAEVIAQDKGITLDALQGSTNTGAPETSSRSPGYSLNIGTLIFIVFLLFPILGFILRIIFGGALGVRRYRRSGGWWMGGPWYGGGIGGGSWGGGGGFGGGGSFGGFGGGSFGGGGASGSW